MPIIHLISDKYHENYNVISIRPKQHVYIINKQVAAFSQTFAFNRGPRKQTKNLMARVARLEENERLTSRVTTEKKDEVLPNVTYAMEDADEDLFRKATISLAAFMKIIEKCKKSGKIY